MVDTRTRVNLTEARIAKFSTLDFAALPLQDAIVTVRGRGTRKFAVFADAECAFCEQLEGVLQERDDITVYTFLMPILGPGSVDKAKAIWCDQDRSGAWGGWHTAHGPAGRPPRCSWSASWRRWRSEPNGNLRSHSVMRRDGPVMSCDDAKTTIGALECESTCEKANSILSDPSPIDEDRATYDSSQFTV